MITIRRKGNRIMVVMDLSFAQSARVAVQPCQCAHVKSNRTTAVRAFFVKVLGRALSLKDGDSAEIQIDQAETPQT